MNCPNCNGTGWIQHQTRVRHTHNSWGPCPIHDARRLPNFVQTSGGTPVLGTDYVLETDVCLAGAPAVNGRCGELECVCAPRPIPMRSRVVPKADPTAVAVVVVDNNFTMVVLDRNERKIVQKFDWLILDVPAFPN